MSVCSHTAGYSFGGFDDSIGGGTYSTPIPYSTCMTGGGKRGKKTTTRGKKKRKPTLRRGASTFKKQRKKKRKPTFRKGSSTFKKQKKRHSKREVVKSIMKGLGEKRKTRKKSIKTGGNPPYQEGTYSADVVPSMDIGESFPTENPTGKSSKDKSSKESSQEPKSRIGRALFTTRKQGEPKDKSPKESSQNSGSFIGSLAAGRGKVKMDNSSLGNPFARTITHESPIKQVEGKDDTDYSLVVGHTSAPAPPNDSFF